MYHVTNGNFNLFSEATGSPFGFNDIMINSRQYLLCFWLSLQNKPPSYNAKFGLHWHMILRNYVLLLSYQSFQIAISWPVDSITSHQEYTISSYPFQDFKTINTLFRCRTPCSHLAGVASVYLRWHLSKCNSNDQTDNTVKREITHRCNCERGFNSNTQCSRVPIKHDPI